MATGSAMFAGMQLVEFIKKKDKKELVTFVLFMVAVLVFALGAGIYQLLHNIQYDETSTEYVVFSLTNIALLLFCIIPYFFYPKPKIKA